MTRDDYILRSLGAFALMSVVPVALLTLYPPVLGMLLPPALDIVPFLLAAMCGIAGVASAPWPPKVKGLAVTLFLATGMLSAPLFMLGIACSHGNCI